MEARPEYISHYTPVGTGLLGLVATLIAFDPIHPATGVAIGGLAGVIAWTADAVGSAFLPSAGKYLAAAFTTHLIGMVSVLASFVLGVKMGG